MVLGGRTYPGLFTTYDDDDDGDVSVEDDAVGRSAITDLPTGSSSRLAIGVGVSVSPTIQAPSLYRLCPIFSFSLVLTITYSRLYIILISQRFKVLQSPFRIADNR